MEWQVCGIQWHFMPLEHVGDPWIVPKLGVPLAPSPQDPLWDPHFPETACRPISSKWILPHADTADQL